MRKVCGALGSQNLCGCRLIKFVGSWVHRIYGALGSQCLWGVGLINFLGP